MQIKIIEVGPRDGLQSEKSFIPTAQKVRLIDSLFGAGIRSVEATSFVSPAAVPQMADAGDVLQRISRPEGSVVSVLAPTSGAHATPSGPERTSWSHSCQRARRTTGRTSTAASPTR